jgi:CheY-like chemotaxis protein
MIRTGKARERRPARPVVLIVEDWADIRTLFAALLEREGFVVMQAGDGPEAVDAARAARPDLVIMDISLPTLDGIEATRQLRADPRTAHIPVIALTGRALGPHELASTEFSGLLEKPCHPAALFEGVRAALASLDRSRLG